MDAKFFQQLLGGGSRSRVHLRMLLQPTWRLLFGVARTANSVGKWRKCYHKETIAGWTADKWLRHEDYLRAASNRKQSRSLSTSRLMST